MSWNPEQYLKFAGPRLRPAVDLLAHVDGPNPRTVYDLGCGAGNVTRLLAERWPTATITGVDDSAEMLATAGRELPGVTWVRQSLQSWTAPQPADLIFSNAALHWLPDHETLFPRLIAQLAAGGTLAVQMPRNFQAPSHTAITETVFAGPWKDKLAPLLRANPVSEPAVYQTLLGPLMRTVDIWQTEYLHVLTGPDPVKEWTKGTWLKTLLDALAGDERVAFEAAYAARVAEAYPPRADGTTLFPFRRLFIVARRA
jgi:trans-aconitate 2-methyltransferase